LVHAFHRPARREITLAGTSAAKSSPVKLQLQLQPADNDDWEEF